MTVDTHEISPSNRSRVVVTQDKDNDQFEVYCEEADGTDALGNTRWTDAKDSRTTDILRDAVMQLYGLSKSLPVVYEDEQYRVTYVNGVLSVERAGCKDRSGVPTWYFEDVPPRYVLAYKRTLRFLINEVQS